MSRAWRVWVGASIVLAFAVTFLAVGLLGGFDGALFMAAAGVWWDAATPTVVRSIGRRLRG